MKGIKNKKSCKITKNGITPEILQEYKKITKDFKYLCSKCGRVAVSKRNLCKPKKM